MASKGETREQLKKRLFDKIDKVFENHLDNVQITDEESESIYCKKAFIDSHFGTEDEIPDECPEPQLLATYDDTNARTLTIEISYVMNSPDKTEPKEE